MLGSHGLCGAAYLSWNWDLQFTFLWSSDRYYCLFLEGLEQPDVLMGHVGPREQKLKEKFPALLMNEEGRQTSSRICGVFEVICHVKQLLGTTLDEAI